MIRVMAVAALITLHGACGGKAVVDPEAAGAGTGGGGGQYEPCLTPTPTGALNPCSGSGGVGAAGFSCKSAVCDQADNIWETACTATGCACYYNFQIECSCTHTGPGDPCDGQTPSCCPAPFP